MNRSLGLPQPYAGKITSLQQPPAEVTILPEVIVDLLVGLYAEQISRAGTARELLPGADPPGADQRRVQPRPRPRRVNHQDLAMTAHPPGGETRFVAKGSYGHEGAPGNTRRSEPPVNPARFTYMSKEKSGGIPNGITTCGRK